MTAVAPEIAARAWLRETGRRHAHATRRATTIAVAEIAPAILLAAGLALAIGGLVAGDASRAALGAGLAALGLVGRGLVSRIGLTLGARASAEVRADLRGRLLSNALNHGRDGSGLVTRSVEGVEALDGYWSRFSAAQVSAAVVPLIALAAIAVASPVAAGILLATLLPFAVGMFLAGTAAAAESRRQFESLERLSALFLDRVRALPAILAFQAEGRATADIGRSSRALAARTRSVLRIAFLSSAILEFFSAISVALVAVYCGFNLLRLLPFEVPETLDLTRAFFALALAPEVYAPLRRLAAAYHDRQAAEAAVSTLEPHLADNERLVPGPRLMQSPRLDFSDVSIAFDGRPVLSGFNLSVAPGEVIALRGPSGSGKTTILRLLLRLGQPKSGSVRVNGAPLSDHGDLSASIAWTGQNPVVIAGTLAENIDLGRTGADRDAIQGAADMAGLTLDLDRVLDERGGGLSGGERRRLGLARAILKDAPVLLLDEPTANLDAEAEAALIETIGRACRGRTCLIATHSDALAAVADREVRL